MRLLDIGYSYRIIIRRIVCQTQSFAKAANVPSTWRDPPMTKSNLHPLKLHWATIVLTATGLFTCQTAFIQPSWGQEQKQVDFAHDILPILQSRCAKCHSNGVFKGDLSLESRDKLIDSGTVELGAHANSQLFERITSSDPDEQMPPEGDRLTAAQVEKFAAWIDTDLVWPAEIEFKRRIFSRPLGLRAVALPDQRSDSDHPVDRIIDNYFRRNSVKPLEPLSDHLFLRRAKLDLLGQLPTIDETRQFADNEDPGKQEKLIDELLSRDRDYADHWISFWNDLLRNDYVGTGYIDGGREQITEWLHRSLITNKPYDRFVRELISPSPESVGFIKGIKWRGRVNASQVEPLQFSQNISQVFLGINMKCASCHDSFIDDWKLNDAYGLAAITAEQPLEIHRCDVPTGETATSKFVFPSVGQIDGSLSRTQRLEQLAALMTSRQNGRFPRTIVNRLWHRMTGRGLVHPVDVMANEAWSEPLLDFLAVDFVDHGYDLKRTLRMIATSRMYRSRSVQASGQLLGSSTSSDFIFRGVDTRRMTAEQLVDAVWTLTGAAPRNIDAKIGSPEDVELTGKWVWKDAGAGQSPAGETVFFRYEFEIDSLPLASSIVTTCDNQFELFVNGKHVAKGTDWAAPITSDIRPELKVGKNVILVQASNQGDSPNPAALFAELLLRSDNKSDIERFGTDQNWDWTESSVNDPAELLNHEQIHWYPAVVLPGANETYESAMPLVQRAVQQFDLADPITARASLVQADLLMRSLGRPNREQVVTTRPETLSTLQALDLSNGEILAGWLQTGANQWLSAQRESKWSDQELVTELFEQALSRGPASDELKVLIPLHGEDPAGPIEDLLWMVVMLPEFQLIQ